MSSNKKRLSIILYLIVSIFLIVTAFFVVLNSSTYARYTTNVRQTIDLTISATKPIMAQNGTWYRGTTPKSEIDRISFVTADYLYHNSDLTTRTNYIESFYADSKNIGTIQCFILKDSNDKKYVLVSGNRYQESDDIFANPDSSNMFVGFTALTEITAINQLNVTDVTNFSSAFSGCTNLDTIGGLSSWATTSATNMSSMFQGCSSLTSIDTTSFDTDLVTDMSSMFKNCSKVGALNISSFNTSSVTNMSSMFEGMAELDALTVSSNYTTASVTNMSSMFKGTEDLASIPVSNFNVQAVTDFSDMFNGSAVTTLDLANWNTSSATNMQNMFKACGVLTTIYASQNFTTSGVTTSTDMFTGCSNIVGAHGTTYDSSKTDKEYARIDTTNNKGYFCGATLTITFDSNTGNGSLPNQYVLSGVQDTLIAENGALSKTHYFFNGWNTMANGSGTSYADCDTITITTNTTLFAVWTSDEATFLAGSAFNNAITTLAGGTSITAIQESTTAPTGSTITISSTDSKREIVAWMDGTTLKYYTLAETIYLNVDASDMLSDLTALSSVDANNWNTSRTTNMSGLFENTTALSTINVGSWSTANVANFSNMFAGSGVTGTLDLSSFNTSSATDMSGMFNGCASMTSVTVSSFDTSNVTTMASMFENTGLTSLNISNFTSTSLTTTANMFKNSDDLVTISASSSFDVSGKTTTDMFLGCTSVVGGAGTHYDANHIDGAYAIIDTTSTPGYFTGNTKQIIFHSNTTTDTTRTQYVLPDIADNLLPNTFTRTGYTFANWNTVAGGTGTTYNDEDSITIASTEPNALNLYAQWSENTYTVTMTINGATWVNQPSPNPGKRTYTQSYTLPVANDMTYTGYTFAGWFESSSFTGNAITSIPANTAENKTVYAKWDENTYTITYNVNGGTFSTTPVTSRTYTQAVNLPSAADISKTGYNFLGWFEDALCTGSAVTTIPANTAEDKEFYAKWSPITYLVRFNSNGGGANNARYISTIHATYDVPFTLPAFNDTFVRTAYVFKGYDTNMSATTPTYLENSTASNLTTVQGASVTMYCIWASDLSILDSGKSINAQLKSLVTPGSTYSSTDNQIEHFTKSATAPTESDNAIELSLSNSPGKTYAWWSDSDKTIYWYSASSRVCFAKDSSYMFANMTELEDVDLTGMRCKNLQSVLASVSTMENMSHMFENCSSLTSFDMDAFDDLTTVTNMSYLFSGCTSLASVDFGSSNTSNVTNMSAMFENCSSLTSIDFGSFSTTNATNMSEMFSGCSAMVSLDFANFNTANVTNSSNIFAGMIHLAQVSYPTSFTLQTSLPAPDGNYISGATGVWFKAGGTYYTPANLPAQGIFHAVDDFKYATFITGPSFNIAIKQFSNPTASSAYDVDKTITAIARSETAPTGTLGTDYICVSATQPSGDTSHDYDYPIFAWLDGTVVYYYSDADLLYLNSICTDMFCNLSTCKSIDLSGVDSSHTTSFTNMFVSCSSLTSLDLTGFDTSNATSMSTMFYYCSNLSTLDVSRFDTSNVTSMYRMFHCCSARQLDVSNWNTSNVTDMSYMFYGCSALTTLDVSNWDTSNVTNMSNMFYGCAKVTTLDVSGFDTSNVKNMGYMFYGCKQLTTLNVSNFNTTNVTNMACMFSSCSNITTLDVHKHGNYWDTSKVTNMSNMFSYCAALQSVDLTGFNTSQVTQIYQMFYGCTAITSLDLSSFNTSNIKDYGHMFHSCGQLTTLNLINFNTSNATIMQEMFNYCTFLTTIYASNNFVTTSVTNSNKMFGGCTHLVGAAGTSYATAFDSSKLDKEYAKICTPEQKGYFTATLATFYDGANFNSAVKTLVAGSSQTASDDDITVTAFIRTDTLPTVSTVPLSQAGDIVGWYDSTTTTVYWYTSATVAYLNEDCSQMFQNFKALTTIDLGLASNYTSYQNVTDISAMFKGCSALTDVYMNDFDTSNITNMSSLFEDCTSLVNLGIGDIDTSAVTDMSSMFKNCSALTRLNIWHFNTANVTDATDMFTGMTNLHEVDVASGMKGTVQSTLFGAKSAWYTNLDLTQTYTTQLATGTTVQVANAAQMTKGAFYDHSTLTTATLVNYGTFNYQAKQLAYFAETGTSKVITSVGVVDNYIKNMRRSMTAAPSGATTVVVSSSTSSLPITIWYDNGTLWYYTTADQIFANTNPYFLAYMDSMSSIDISGWDFSKVTSFRNVFSGAGMKCLDTSGIDTTSSTSFERIFFECDSLIELDCTGFNTSNVTTLAQGFYDCKKLEQLDISTWNTGNITNLSYTFYACINLLNINLSSWNTSNVTTLQGTFYSCSALTTLDLHTWNTGSVTTMQSTFAVCTKLTSLNVTGWDTSNVTNMYSTFGSCTSLATLNLNDWNTANVTTLYCTFSNCTGLTTLNISNWNTANVTTLYCTFQSCKSLTTLNISNWNTSNVTNMEKTFYECSSLTNIDLHTNGNCWDVSNVVTFYSMFTSCSKLTTLNITGWTTSSATTIAYMFNCCSKLNNVDFSSFDTSKVTSLNYMFNICSGFTSLDLSSFRTPALTSMYKTFFGCTGLTELNLTAWDVSKVTTMYCAFQYCNNLTSLDLSGWHTSSLTDMTNTFYGCTLLENLYLDNWDSSKITTLNSTFTDCCSLKSLDLTSWDTSNVTNMNATFYNLKNVKGIYVSNSFVTTAVTSSTNMFKYCYNIVGESGTTYDANHITAEYACIDVPVENAPGYLSYNRQYNIKYYDYEHSTLHPDYIQYPSQLPATYKRSQTITLPVQEDLVNIPAGKKLDGWLERDGDGWKSEVIYEIPQNSRGDIELTPNWVDDTAE